MDPLISTKLLPARSRPRLVARPRLSQRLDSELGRRLTLVSASAGFGKTTLLSGWWERRQRSERYAAWLSLDEGDNDPARLLRYLVAAIALAVDAQEFGEGVLAALSSPEPPRTEALLGALVNEMTHLRRGLNLVLDDYHAINSATVHNLLSRLLERLPDDTHAQC